uniref:Uncharacterized protein n=1 Tax=Oryza meridionalis TaxID=40149 RepID=A0A0E0EAW5_9ORYZ
MPVEAEAAQTSSAEGQQRCPNRRAAPDRRAAWSWSWMDAFDVEPATEIGVCAEEGVGYGGGWGSTGDGHRWLRGGGSKRVGRPELGLGGKTADWIGDGMEAAVGGETGRRREGDGFDSGEKGDVRQKRIAWIRLRRREGGSYVRHETNYFVYSYDRLMQEPCTKDRHHQGHAQRKRMLRQLLGRRFKYFDDAEFDDWRVNKAFSVNSHGR